MEKQRNQHFTGCCGGVDVFLYDHVQGGAFVVDFSYVSNNFIDGAPQAVKRPDIQRISRPEIGQCPEHFRTFKGGFFFLIDLLKETECGIFLKDLNKGNISITNNAEFVCRIFARNKHIFMKTRKINGRNLFMITGFFCVSLLLTTFLIFNVWNLKRVIFLYNDIII
jgi:hypothetical protein